jgi:hypothetical protein
VLTIPRLLRPLLRRGRDLLRELARAAAAATVELVRREAGPDLRPGLVVSVATAGDLLQWHPHLHLLTCDRGFATDGTFVSLARWDATLQTSLFRERILARLLDRRAIPKSSSESFSPGDTPASPPTWTRRSLLWTSSDSVTPPPTSSETPP